MRNEVNFQRAEFLQREHKLFDAACETIESPDHNHVERAAAGVSHQWIQAWSSFLDATQPVGIDPVQRPSAVCDQISERPLLNGGVLLKCDYLAVP
jgi:hypothetical protein